MTTISRFMREEPELFVDEQYEMFSYENRTTDYRTIEEKMRDITWLLEDDSRLTNLTPAEEFLIAESTEASATNLDCLAEHTQHEAVRTVIAQNYNTAGDTLHLLSQISVSEETLTALITNDGTATDTLIFIVLDETVPLTLKERIVEHYRFDEVADELIHAHGVEYDCFPESWKHALSEGTN